MWIKGPPKIDKNWNNLDGRIFFRTTLWGRVVRADLVNVDGIIKIYTEEGLRDVRKVEPKWFWFHVPEPPPEADWVSMQKRKKK